MTLYEDVLRDAPLPVPPRPPIDELRRRTSIRRARRRRLVAVPAVVLAAVIGAAVVMDDARRTEVLADDPLAAALRPYGSELTLEPSEPGDDALEIPFAVPGSVEVVGRLEGQPVALFSRADEDGANVTRCLAVGGVAAQCRVAFREPSTFATSGHIIWVNVPEDAVAVGLNALDGSRWTRPIDGFAYFPVDGESWHRFDVRAFAADGSVVALEEYAAGEHGRMRWYAEDGRVMERTHEKRETEVREVEDVDSGW